MCEKNVNVKITKLNKFVENNFIKIYNKKGKTILKEDKLYEQK